MNFGTVGTGWITDEFIEASKESIDFTHTAVYSRSSEKGETFANKHAVEHVFTDLNEMAANSNLEAVYIASPNSLHFEHVMTFLKQKKHVICEKPIFSNVAEWQKAYQAAADNDVYLFEAMRTLHSPNFKSLTDGLQAIGQVRSMILPFVQYSSRYDDYLAGKEPNMFTTKSSGGALTDLGVYPLTLAVGLFGRPAGASYFPVLLDSGVDGSGTLVLTYAGFTGTILCSKLARSSNTCEIHGEKGRMVFDNTRDMYQPRVIMNHNDEEKPLPADDHPNNMIYEIQAFTRMIESSDTDEYERLKQISYDVLAVTEKVRHENGIIFDSEKSD